nr:amino acid synthesis family protein [Mesorhizobium sp. M7A.F.Ca.US.005.03.1.1]
MTANFQIADGPAADEIVVAIGAADGGWVGMRQEGSRRLTGTI